MLYFSHGSSFFLLFMSPLFLSQPVGMFNLNFFKMGCQDGKDTLFRTIFSPG